jgi:DNA (cytosine-5)-methyltransferase 1
MDTEPQLRVLDLFTGIGGFTLGLERAGMRTVAMCESDPFCREWLQQRWPQVPCYPDVRQLDGGTVGHVDVVCGGFPCQDVASSGLRAGLAGARSGLWFQMLRILREVQPTFVIVENVTGLRVNGADRVLSDLEAANYTCWPFVVGAGDLGFPHRRKRVWIVGVAHRDSGGCESQRFQDQCAVQSAPRDITDGCSSARPNHPRHGQAQLVHADSIGSDGRVSAAATGTGQHPEPADANHRCHRLRIPARPGEPQHPWEAARIISAAECRLGAAADGIPARMGATLNRARLRAAGNSIVPHIAEIIGRAVIRVARELNTGR